MVDVWGSFARGAQIGGALREQAEQRQRQEAYGTAFDQGGWGAVAKQAGSMGDLELASGIQEQQTAQEEAAIARAQRNATVLGNAATSLLGVPYEQRATRLQQMSPMLEQMGLDPQQIAAFDPTDEALSGIRAIQGQFSQYTDIRQQGDAIVGIRADGSVEVLRQEEPAAPSGYQWNQDRSAVQRIPGYEGQIGSGSGGTQYRPITPDEARSYNLPGNGDGFVIGDNGLPRRIGGGGTFPADQRARVAISYEPALEAARFLERADAQAVQRQGSHGSDTPLGQDWGARVLEAVPFDGGSAARIAGGEDYQQYVRASSAFEAAMLPILSGAAVTESEAQRIVRAALPRFGDDQATLAAKARQRRQMLNGAALIGGRQPPYPQDSIPDWATQAAANVQMQSGADVGIEGLSDEQLDALEQELMARGQ